VVLRDGEEKEIEVEIGTLPGGPQMAGRTPSPGPAAFGLRAQDLTPDIAEQLGVEDAEGVVVTGVDPDSPAAEAGIRRGDVVLEVDKSTVSNVGDLRAKLEEAGDSALLVVRRGDATLFVALKRAG